MSPIRLFLTAMTLIASSAAMSYAQTPLYKWDLGVQAGLCGYEGDIARGWFYNTPGAQGAATLRYLADARWALRSSLRAMTVKASSAGDKNFYPDNAVYSFRSGIYSLELGGEYNFVPYGEGESYKQLHRLTPYLTAGVGIALSRTDHQTTAAFEIPFGVGVKYRLRPRLTLSAELTFVKTLTDRIDRIGDLYGINSSFLKNTDWLSTLSIGISYEFAERCIACHRMH